MRAVIIRDIDAKNLDHCLSDLKIGIDFYERYTEGDIKDRASGYKRIISMIETMIKDGTVCNNRFVRFQDKKGNEIFLDSTKITHILREDDLTYLIYFGDSWVQVVFKGSMIDFVSTIEAAIKQRR